MSPHLTPDITYELESVTVGGAADFGGLTIFPVFRDNPLPPELGYALLEDALTRGTARVNRSRGLRLGAGVAV